MATTNSTPPTTATAPQFTSLEAMAQQFQKTVLGLKTQSDYVADLWRMRTPGNPQAALLSESDFEERVVELFHAKAQAVKFLSEHYDTWSEWKKSSGKTPQKDNAQNVGMALFSLLEDKHLTFNSNEKDIVSRFTQSRKAHKTQPFLKEDVEIFAFDLKQKEKRDSLYKKITQDLGVEGLRHRIEHEVVVRSALATEQNNTQYQALLGVMSQHMGAQYDEVWQTFKQKAKKGELSIEHTHNKLVCSFTVAPSGEKRFPMPTTKTYSFTCESGYVNFQPMNPQLAQKIETARGDYFQPTLTAKNLTL